MPLTRDQFDYYLNFARRVFSKCIHFSGETYASEKTSLINEFVLRGLDADLLEDLITLIDADCYVVREILTVLELLNQLLEDIGHLHFESHNRTRVYPQNVTLMPTLTSAAVADTFGAWVEIIPLNTIPFPFHVLGLCVCTVSAATSYHFQLGYNVVVADPPANFEMGERRVRFAVQPIARQTELLMMHSQGIPANSRVMGRMKTASGNADTAEVHVVLTRHLEVSDMPALYPSFPW